MMMDWKKLTVGLMGGLLSACATGGTNLQIHQVNALSSVDVNDGSFRGLEFLADPIPRRLKNRVNIFYLHGIGWTENPDNDHQLGNDFLSGVAKAYNLSVDGPIIDSPCGGDEAHIEGEELNHIFITTGDQPTFYETTIPGARLKLDKLACMDKQVLEVDDALEFVVYRIFWDDRFWRMIQSPHVGQDDNLGASQNIAGMRRKYNRELKDQMVNYGFSDAVMYLGPAGNEIRNAVKGAMCSAALDAAGYSLAKQGHDVAYDQACNTASASAVKVNQFAFVTESLGSKITFDVMRDAITDGRDTILDEMIAGSETYMLANQLALLSLADLSRVGKNKPELSPDKPRPKVIAFSELNDFLTYETGAFFEQLWTRQYRDDPKARPPFDEAARQSVIEGIGFEFVDLRLEFADGVIPFVSGLVDPMQAHLGHAGEPELMLYMLCGAKDGKLQLEGCLATQDEE